MDDDGTWYGPWDFGGIEIPKESDVPNFCPECSAYWDCEHKKAGLTVEIDGTPYLLELKDNKPWAVRLKEAGVDMDWYHQMASRNR